VQEKTTAIRILSKLILWCRNMPEETKLETDKLQPVLVNVLMRSIFGQ